MLTVVVIAAGVTAWQWHGRVTARILTGHTEQVDGLAYSPDGQLASGSADGTVRIWDPETGAARVLTGHTSYVNAVAYSPDGDLASASMDDTVRIWPVETR